MEFETVRKPIDAFQKEVLRLGTTWTREGRYLGAVALRSSAQRLVATAGRLDDLATRLEPAEPPPAAIEAEADAAAVAAVAAPVEVPEAAPAQSEGSVVVGADAPDGEPAASAEPPSAEPPSTAAPIDAPARAPAASPSESGKRRHRR